MKNDIIGVERAIKNIRELSKSDNRSEEIKEYASHPHEIVRREAAKYADDKDLKLFAFDISAKVRGEAARRGYNPRIMSKDPSPGVRVNVVYAINYNNTIEVYRDIINALTTDPSAKVRTAIADIGYNLDIFVNDKSPRVRASVARQGFYLDELINDQNWLVRKNVAYSGYGLDILVKDRNPYVRAAVANMGYGLDILVNDRNDVVVEAVIEQGYKLENFLNIMDDIVREKAYKIYSFVQFKNRMLYNNIEEGA